MPLILVSLLLGCSHLPCKAKYQVPTTVFSTSCKLTAVSPMPLILVSLLQAVCIFQTKPNTKYQIPFFVLCCILSAVWLMPLTLVSFLLGCSHLPCNAKYQIPITNSCFRY